MAIFQRVMEEELNECLGSGAFFDDVICTGENDDLDDDVDRVLHQLNERGFELKPQKFVYMADKITYRGHEITANGVSSSPDKVNSLKEATPPSNVNELQSFLGSANFLRKFVPKFAEIVAPLYDLLKKGNQWKWGPAENEAFVRLKNNICEESMLAHYDLKNLQYCRSTHRDWGSVQSSYRSMNLARLDILLLCLETHTNRMSVCTDGR